MTDAIMVVQDAAIKIPGEIQKRITASDNLSAQDRDVITRVAQEALIRFMPDAEPNDKIKINPQVQVITKAE